MKRTMAIWLLAFISAYAVLWLGARLYDESWIPTGGSLPYLASVAGDTWAVAADRRVFQYVDKSSVWLYVESGQWQEWDRTSGERVLSVHQGPSMTGDIIETDTSLWYGRSQVKTEKPRLDGQPQDVGGAFLCGTSSYRAVDYVVSTRQVAFLDASTETWQVRTFRSGITLPVVAAGCRLYYTIAGELRYVEMTLAEGSGFEGVAVSDSMSVPAQPAKVTNVVSSGFSLWALMSSGDAYEVIPGSPAGTQWQLLPRPPQAARPRLICGTEGWMFSPSAADVDLWLFDDATQAAYWLSRGAHAWVPFAFPGGRLPAALTSVTTNSETVGSKVVRLAVVNGRLYRQRPMSANPLWLVTAAPCISLIACTAMTLPLLAQRRAKRRPTTRSSRLGGLPPGSL